MLVGVPGSGKSTWIENRSYGDEGRGRNTTVLSTDYYIECVAKDRGLTYNEVFHDAIKDADRTMWKNLEWAIERDDNIMWDQTNLNRKSRAPKLNAVPSTYRKIGILFPVPPLDELERRLASRPGKLIPKGVMQNMIDCLTQPLLEEGFDEVRVANV
jgi:predicted kinase